MTPTAPAGVDLPAVGGSGGRPSVDASRGDGLSVRQIMTAMAKVTGIDFDPDIGPRRAGDPDRIVADGTLAARDLHWEMRHSVEDMVASAYEAQKRAVSAVGA